MSGARTEMEKQVVRLAQGPGYQDWAGFMTAFRAYVDERKDECVQASPDRLSNSQGQAQACAALQHIFENAVKAAASRARAQQ